MKRKMFVVLISLIMILSMILVYADELNLPDATSDFYVYDGADIINTEIMNHIIDTNELLYQKTGAQIVVATIKSLDGVTIEEYAAKLFEKWKIGSKEKDNGILLLIAPNDRQVRIEVGYGLESVITDGIAGDILDEYILYYFKEDDYQNGVLNGFDAILARIQEEYNMEVTVEPSGAYDDMPIWGWFVVIPIMLLLFGVIISIIIYFIMYIFNIRNLRTNLHKADDSKEKSYGRTLSERNRRGSKYRSSSSSGGNSGGGGSSGGGGASGGW